MVNIIPAKYQHASIVFVSMLMIQPSQLDLLVLRKINLSTNSGSPPAAQSPRTASLGRPILHLYGVPFVPNCHMRTVHAD